MAACSFNVSIQQVHVSMYVSVFGTIIVSMIK